MTDKHVWYPIKSRAAADRREQESGWGSTVQPKTPAQTIKPRVPLKTREREKTRIARDHLQKMENSYSTVERRSGLSILTFSDLPIANGAQSVSQDFSGWQDHEVLTSTPNRRVVQTPAVGLRSTAHSRLESRGCQRRRDVGYEFQHFLDAHLHMEHYRAHYCYTTLSTAAPESTVPELVDQGKQTLLKLEVKSLYRGDPYLRELASRLGVGDSIRDPQLLTPQKHTPPSIVKKQRARSDLAIDLVPKSRSDEEEDDLCTPGTAWTVDPAKVPTSPSKALELPRIPEVASIPHKDKTSSTISINKYLRVSSQGEEGSESNHTLPQVPTSHTLLSDSSQDLLEVTECTVDRERPLFPMEPVIKPVIHILDQAQKERLITHTAQALGLTSREWATPLSNKQINRYLDYNVRPSTRQQEKTNCRQSTKQHDKRPPSTKQQSIAANEHTHTTGRPTTRQERSPTRQDLARPSTRQDVVRPNTRQDVVRPSTRQDVARPSTRQQELRSGKHTRPPTRQHSKTRPSTRHDSKSSEHKRSRPQSTVRHREKLNRLKSIYTAGSPSHSRPPTRAHTRLKIRESGKRDPLDDSCYWNELRGPTQDRDVKQGFSPVRLAIELSTAPSQQTHPVNTGVLRSHKSKRPKNRVNEELTPGASPIEIARHLSRLKRRFDGVLNIHKHETSSAN